MSMYDVVIIGAGPAGLTAALYAGRSRLKTKVYEKLGAGGQMLLTERIENYPGFPEGIAAGKLVEHLVQQVQELDIDIETNEVEAIKEEGHFIVVTAQGEPVATHAVIIATGASYKTLGIPGEDRLRSRGVSYCAICDGPLFRGKDVIVIGGGNAAAEEALTLEKAARKVTLIHRRNELRATKILQEQLLSRPKIEIVWDSIPVAFQGQNVLESLVIRNVKTGKEQVIPAQGAFVSIGLIPNTGFVKNLLKLDDSGAILTDDTMATSITGVFACGDCRKKTLRQIVTACGDGAVAAYSVFTFLESRR